MIAEAMQRVTKDGVITVEESLTTDLDVVEGMQLDRGYISPYFTDNERMVVEFETLDPAHRQENQHHPGFDSPEKSPAPVNRC